MAARARLTLKGGQVRYVTVMFPNSPYWAEQYRQNPNIRKIELLVDTPTPALTGETTGLRPHLDSRRSNAER